MNNGKIEVWEKGGGRGEIDHCCTCVYGRGGDRGRFWSDRIHHSPCSAGSIQTGFVTSVESRVVAPCKSVRRLYDGGFWGKY